MNDNEKMAIFISKVGISFTFLYAAVSSILNPSAWIGYFPQFLKNIVPSDTLLLAFSVYQILLSFWLLSEWKLFYSSLISLFTLLGVVIFNLAVFDIVFRDIPMILMAIMLLFIGYRRR